MTTTSEKYRRNAAGFNTRVEGVPADAWSRPSPCEDWTARDIVRHVVDTCGLFLGFAGEKLPDAPSVDDDPVAAWHSARDTIQSALDNPEIAQREYDGMWGKATFEQGVDKFLAVDATLHTWDLARATGQDETLDEDAVNEAMESLHPMDDKMRGPGAFAEKIDPPQSEDPQTKLLNFCGRTV